jgi:hypothetical protein
MEQPLVVHILRFIIVLFIVFVPKLNSLLNVTNFGRQQIKTGSSDRRFVRHGRREPDLRGISERSLYQHYPGFTCMMEMNQYFHSILQLLGRETIRAGTIARELCSKIFHRDHDRKCKINPERSNPD